MTAPTANGHACIGATIRLPRSGVWMADLRVDHPEGLAGDVELLVGTSRLKGRVPASRSGVFEEAAAVRVIGGAGGMSKPCRPAFYRFAPARTVVQDILEAVGEALASSSDAELLGQQLPAYCQPRQMASAALAALCDRLGAIWRVLLDGTVWVGRDTWPPAADAGTLLIADSRNGAEVYSAEAPALMPGTVLNGRRISQVEHDVAAARVETSVWYEAGDAQAGDRQTRALIALVDRATAHTDFHVPRRARVVAQNADLTLELQPDDGDLPGLSHVPIRYGIPGVKAKVPPGARVIFVFEDGDAARPAVVAWEPDALLELDINGALEAAVLGTTYRTAEDTMVSAHSAFATALQTLFTAINTYATAIQAIADPTSSATPALTAALTAATTAVTTLTTALAAFEAAAATYLSPKVKLG